MRFKTHFVASTRLERPPALLEIRDWHRVGDELKQASLDLQTEIKQFTAIFERFVVRTGSPFGLLLLREIRSIPERLAGAQIVKTEEAEPLPQPTSSEEQTYHAEVNVAESLRLAGRPAAAKQVLENLENRIDGNEVTNHLRYRIETNLGACEVDLGENQRAANHFERALTHAPSDYKALSNAAYAGMLRGEYETALDLAEQAMQQSPEAAKTAAPAVQLQREPGSRISRGSRV